MAKLSVILQGVGAGVGFMPTAWGRAWGAMLAAGLLLAVLWASQALAPAAPWRFGALGVVLATLAVADGALYRLALPRAGASAANAGWGLAEARLAAVLALCLIFLGVLCLLAFVVLLSFAFALASAGRGFVTALPMTWAGAVDDRGRLVMTVVAGLCLAGVGWAATRLALAPAASVARGRIQVLASWPSTRGLVLPIIVGRIVLGVAPLGFAAWVIWAASRGARPASPTAWAASVAAGVAIAGGWLPLNAGFMAWLYARQPVP